MKRAAIVQKRLETSISLLTDLKNTDIKSSFLSEEKTFTIDSVFNQLNDRLVTIENNVSDHHRVSKTKHPASSMMFGVVASNMNKLSLVWCERSYRLTSAVYKEIFDTKAVPWVHGSEISLRLREERSAVTHGKDCAVGRQHEVLTQRFLVQTVTRLGRL